MATEDQLHRLVSKWQNDSEGFRAEARRLERSDQGRHAASIAMLEARAQAIERCMIEVQALK